MHPIFFDIMALTLVMILTSILFAVFRAVIGKRSINPFDGINLITGVCVAYLVFYFQTV